MHRPPFQLAAFLTLALLFVVPPTAQAQSLSSTDESVSQRMQRPFAVDGHLGLGTPIGTSGVTATWSVLDWLAISGGAGLGWAGPQLALTPRLQFTTGGLALGAGVGISGGAYEWEEPTFHNGSSKTSSAAYWANAQATLDYQFDFGLRLGAQLGYGRLLNPGRLQCQDSYGSEGHCERDHADDGLQIPFGGFYVGYAL